MHWNIWRVNNANSTFINFVQLRLGVCKANIVELQVKAAAILNVMKGVLITLSPEMYRASSAAAMVGAATL